MPNYNVDHEYDTLTADASLRLSERYLTEAELEASRRAGDRFAFLKPADLFAKDAPGTLMQRVRKEDPLRYRKLKAAARRAKLIA
jgi:hypothetical protein